MSKRIVITLTVDSVDYRDAVNRAAAQKRQSANQWILSLIDEALTKQGIKIERKKDSN